MDNAPNRTLTLVMAALVALLVGAAFAFGEEEEEPARADATAAVAGRVGTIARRVEEIRGTRFRSRPRPVIVTPEQARETSLEELDRSYDAEARRADEQLLELLGLVEPGIDLRGIQSDVAGDQVVGFYDTRRKRLALVRGGQADQPVLAEITLAHELTHALEDQRFDLEEREGTADDAASAYSALVEGSATAVMTEYARKHVPPGQVLAAALGSVGAGGTESIPPYVQRSLEFSYVGGQRFVEQLVQVARGWRLVDYAFTRHPPDSTEQIIHPEKYLSFERPLDVRLRTRPVLPRGWRRVRDGTMGEYDTRELLRLGDRDSADGAAAGWGGGRFELWRAPAAPPRCPRPCRRASAIVLSWRWDTPRDAREFARALPRYVERGLSGRAGGRATWRVGDGAAAIEARGTTTTLAMAPDAALAQRLARRAPERGR